MRKKSVRLASAALAVCMMLSALPMGAFAAEPGTEPENGVSAQAEETLPFEGKEITEGGTYTMPEGPYTGNFVINTDDDVKIEITGDVTYEYSPKKEYLFYVKKVGTLTVDGGTHKIRVNTTTADGAILTVGSSKHVIFEGGHYEQDNRDAMFVLGGTGVADLNHVEAVGPANVVWNTLWSKMTVNINGGKYVSTDAWPTLMCSGGTTYINDVEATNSGENIAVCVKYAAATVEINNGIYTSGGNVVNVSGGTCTINGGTYRATGQYSCVTNNSGVAAATVNIHGGVFEGAGTVIGTSNTGTTTIDEKVAKTVIRNIDGEDESIHKTGVNSSGTATTIIDGCTIENSERGVRVGDGTPSVTLKNAEFNNNTNDIYLNADQKITIEDTFTDTATVKCANAASGRQITTNNTTGQEKLKLISNDVDANGKTYLVAYDPDNNYRYLTPRAEDKYTVTAENATAALVDGTPLYSYDEIEAGKDVTLTADAPEDGWVFAGWQVTEGGLTLDDTADTVTFQMPTSDVVVSAQYEYVGTPDAAADNIKGALSAVVVGAAAGAIIYEAGTGIYRVINMPGIPMPSNRIELAELLWERADKPEPVSTALYSDIDEGDTDAQKAAHWAVEQDLMQDNSEKNTFNPHFPVSKLRTCLTWNAAKEKGLFDTDKTAE